MHFNIPAISYRAAAPTLEEKAELPFLFRSTPCDSKLYAAMARQIDTMSPSALGVIVEDSEYGRRGKDVFARELTAKGLTNVRFQPIPAHPEPQDVIDAVSNLVAVPGASLLAFVVSDSITAEIMEGLSLMDAALLRPIIGPAGFGNFLNISNAKRFENMVVVRHTLSPMPGFDGYYRRLCEKGGNTPWWHEKWESLGEEELTEKRIQCHQAVPDKPQFHFAANAIYALAHALRRFVVTSCSAAEKSACAQYLEQCWARESILGHLRTVNFNPLGAQPDHRLPNSLPLASLSHQLLSRFTFDRNQDVEPNYEMVQLKVRSSIVQWDATP